jgi:DNA-directed RNA polymerase specialized sigma24 family protein
VGAYLLLRREIRGTWLHGLDLDAIVSRDGRLYWANPGRHPALADRRWLEKVDADLWHESMLEVLAWIERHGVDPQGLMAWLEDDQARVVKWLRNFKFNAQRVRWRNHEFAVGTAEGYVDVSDNPAENKEVRPPKGFRLPPPHSWRRQFLAYEPDLELSEDLRRALATLPAVDRALFLQHHVLDVPVKTLAAEFELKVNAVKKKLKVSKRRLRDFLSEKTRRRGRPPKNYSKNGDPNGGNSCLSVYIPRGVTGAPSHQQNGDGPSTVAAPRISEEMKVWPVRIFKADYRQRVLKWKEEGTHGQKRIWKSVRYGTIGESWTRCKPMAAFF